MSDFGGIVLQKSAACVEYVGAEAAYDRRQDKLGSITKQGNRYLRWLLVAGAMAVIRYAQTHGAQNCDSRI